MPKRTDLQSILILRSGHSSARRAEVDYSGTQAVRTFRADGYRVILGQQHPDYDHDGPRPAGL